MYTLIYVFIVLTPYRLDEFDQPKEEVKTKLLILIGFVYRHTLILLFHFSRF